MYLVVLWYLGTHGIHVVPHGIHVVPHGIHVVPHGTHVVPHGMLWYSVVPCGTTCNPLVQFVNSGPLWYPMVHCGTFWCTVVHCGTHWYRVIPSGALVPWYTQLPWHPRVPNGTVVLKCFSTRYYCGMWVILMYSGTRYNGTRYHT